MKGICSLLFSTLILLAGCNNHSQPVTNAQQESQSYSLSYQDTKLAVPLIVSDSREQIVTLSSTPVNSHTVDIYSTGGENEELYAALHISTNNYKLGQIGYALNQAADITIEEVNALSQSYIKIAGFCGANCPNTNYIQVDAVVPLLLHIEAHTVEADVDEDGISEIIATVGTAAQTSVYKLDGDRVVVANLNEIMNALAVTYDNRTNHFQAESAQGVATSWKIHNNRLQFIP